MSEIRKKLEQHLIELESHRTQAQDLLRQLLYEQGQIPINAILALGIEVTMHETRMGLNGRHVDVSFNPSFSIQVVNQFIRTRTSIYGIPNLMALVEGPPHQAPLYYTQQVAPYEK